MGRDNPPGRWEDGSVQIQAAPMDRPLRPQENDMINDKMLSYLESQGLLIDGFSRELKQAKEFEHIDPNICEGVRH
ncbi:adenylate kinase isoenzyme 1-like [Myotis myotis]|uniref:adenylate kinase isoenzyme 1-like n=1 Tax=Myotis myotis TaxID=51298 RepID=UPI00174A24CB|nr:adenylate kinase isoenzyme 1-like [Myotis myotis]